MALLAAEYPAWFGRERAVAFYERGHKSQEGYTSVSNSSRRSHAPVGMARVLVGLSPLVLRAAPRDSGTTLQCLDPSVARWVMAHDAIAVLIPSLSREAMVRDTPAVSAADFASRVDALILHGGADIDPRGLAESPSKMKRSRDRVNELFEADLLLAFIAADKPVLGIGRGMHLINIALGGTLLPDSLESGATADPGHGRAVEEGSSDALRVELDGWLSQLHDGLTHCQVRSPPLQRIDRLGEGLSVQARSAGGVIEAIRHQEAGFLVGVQWHPELHDARISTLLASDRLMTAFLAASRVRDRRNRDVSASATAL